VGTPSLREVAEGEREAHRLDAEAQRMLSDLAEETPGFYNANRSGAKTLAAFGRLQVSENARARYRSFVADPTLGERSAAAVAAQFEPIKQGTHCLFASKYVRESSIEREKCQSESVSE
jgi:hypothetical protein